ncbi:MAG: class I SAM-dependent methyltransferase [Vicingaceae bacterium]
MPYDFHKDKKRYIKYQRENALKYVIPFIEKKLSLKEGMRVMEIGCAEGGVLQAFIEKGCHGTGVELQSARYEMAKDLLKQEIQKGQASLSNKDIYDVEIDKEYPEKFDLIVLKDVIEHIHDQDKVLAKLREFLKPGGHIFFGFPPWQMPFGGHQQIAKSKILNRLPYYHLLPMKLYRAVLKSFGEPTKTIDDLAEIKQTGISIERFEKLLKKNHFSQQKREFYLINPIYKYKFKLNAKVQNPAIAAIPYLRNYLTTCVYYLVKKESL